MSDGTGVVEGKSVEMTGVVGDRMAEGVRVGLTGVDLVFGVEVVIFVAVGNGEVVDVVVEIGLASMAAARMVIQPVNASKTTITTTTK